MQRKISGTAGELEAVLHLPVGVPRAIAIIAHPLTTMDGTMNNKIVTTLAKTFAELGFVALRFNFRGAGNSAGSFDEGHGETEDMLAVVQYAKNTFGADLPLVLSGFSFGGYVAARAGAISTVNKLVLIAPAIGRFAMPQVADNTLLIHGELDEVIPLSDTLKWAGSQLLPVVVVPDTGHFFHGRLGQLKQIILLAFNGIVL
jgi:hypothetical protein